MSNKIYSFRIKKAKSIERRLRMKENEWEAIKITFSAWCWIKRKPQLYVLAMYRNSSPAKHILSGLCVIFRIFSHSSLFYGTSVSHLWSYKNAFFCCFVLESSLNFSVFFDCNRSTLMLLWKLWFKLSLKFKILSILVLNCNKFFMSFHTLKEL